MALPCSLAVEDLGRPVALPYGAASAFFTLEGASTSSSRPISSKLPTSGKIPSSEDGWEVEVLEDFDPDSSGGELGAVQTVVISYARSIFD